METPDSRQHLGLSLTHAHLNYKNGHPLFLHIAAILTPNFLGSLTFLP